MFFGKYLKLKLHSCRISLNLGVKSKSLKVEKVSVTVQNIKALTNHMQCDGDLLHLQENLEN